MRENNFLLKLLLIGMFASVAFFVYPALKEMERKKEIEAEIALLEQEKGRLERDSRFLEEKIAYFETQEYKERVSKERLNMRKDGEKVVYVKPGTEGENLKNDQAREKEAVLGKKTKDDDDVPSYKKWWRYFFEY